MKQVLSPFSGKRIRFLTSSNEKINELNFKDYDCRLCTGHPVANLYSLARCDYIIGPPSTYSVWANYYGEAKYQHFLDAKSKVLLSDFI